MSFFITELNHCSCKSPFRHSDRKGTVCLYQEKVLYLEAGKKNILSTARSYTAIVWSSFQHIYIQEAQKQNNNYIMF